MPTWLEAGLWGLLGGGALVLGALVAWFAPRAAGRRWPSVMAFGSGVLISAVAFDLMEEAEADRRAARDGGRLPRRRPRLPRRPTSSSPGTAPSIRKRSGDQQPSEQEQAGSGMAIAVGRAARRRSRSPSSWGSASSPADR